MCNFSSDYYVSKGHLYTAIFGLSHYLMEPSEFLNTISPFMTKLFNGFPPDILQTRTRSFSKFFGSFGRHIIQASAISLVKNGA